VSAAKNLRDRQRLRAAAVVERVLETRDQPLTLDRLGIGE
jgi:hypothetical protein